MSSLTQTIILVFLIFVLLPVVALSSITIIRNIYRLIRGKSVISLSKFIIILLIALISLAVVPPIPYIISEAHASTSNVILTGKTAKIFYDKGYDENNVRYIKYKGTIYQELIPSISNVEYYDDSESIGLEYGKPLANALDENQSLIEKYVCKVFRYPVNSRYIYPIQNEGFSEYISLDHSDLFYPRDKINDKVAYFSDTTNYNYYAEDYNTDKTYSINLNAQVASEILTLSTQAEIIDNSIIQESIPGVSVINDKTDYDTVAINGESKDQLLLKFIGQIYVKKNKFYQIVGEEYHDDGTTDLYVFPLSTKAASEISKEFKKVGLI